ncbi:MAG: tetratricopeptide repeat protein [Planctomycetota bacterium]|jgi:tetratricopeptide (TPR) repeat protein
MHAEHAYLFRHALLRDVAYQMQLPQDRAAQHRVVLVIAESLWGLPPDIDEPDEGIGEDLPVDPHIDELVVHADTALEDLSDPEQKAPIRQTLLRYLRRAGRLASARFENSKVVSIYIRLASEFATDPARVVKDLVHASHIARFDDIELAEELAQQALTEAERIGTPEPILEALTGCARIRFTVRDFESAMEFLRRAEKLLQPGLDERVVAKLLSVLSTTSVQVDEPDVCESRFQRALEYCREHKLAAQEWATLANYSNLFARIDRYDENERILRQAITHPAYNPDYIGTPYVHGNLAETLTRRNELKEAEEHYWIALKGHQRFGNLLQQGWISGTMAKLLNRRGKHEVALTCLKSAIEALSRLGDLTWVGGIKSELGRTYLMLGKPELAEESFESSLDYQERFDPRNYETVSSRIAAIRKDPAKG